MLLLFPVETHNGGESSGCISVAESDETQQGDYDVLPIRNSEYDLHHRVLRQILILKFYANCILYIIPIEIE